MNTCALLVIILSVLLVPFGHHFEAVLPPAALQATARLFDTLPYFSDFQPSQRDKSSWSIYHASALHVSDSGLSASGLDDTLPPEMHRLVRNAHAKGEFYFEGWYYKLTASDNSKSMAVIPGLLINETHEFGFVMFADPGAAPSMTTYPISEVVVQGGGRQRDPDFYIQIGPNKFAATSLELNLPGVVRGRLTFKSIEPLPASPLFPTIMGWFAFIPGEQLWSLLCEFHSTKSHLYNRISLISQACSATTAC
jgi:hypothetical protein